MVIVRLYRPVCRVLPFCLLAALTALQSCGLGPGDVKEAIEARKKSDSLMREFKKTDRELDSVMQASKRREDSFRHSPDYVNEDSLMRKLKQQ
jgi:hypothetical protein